MSKRSVVRDIDFFFCIKDTQLSNCISSTVTVSISDSNCYCTKPFRAETAVSEMVQQLPSNANVLCSCEIAAVLKGGGLWNFKQGKKKFALQYLPGRFLPHFPRNAPSFVSQMQKNGIEKSQI